MSLRRISRNLVKDLERLRLPTRSTANISNKRLLSTNNYQFIHRSEQPKPSFTTSAYNEAGERMKSQAKLAGKIVGYTILSVSAAVGLVWQMSHWYIEHVIESTPPELGYQARNLLHGAYVREHIAVNYEVAAFYVREALRIALEEKQLPESFDTVIQLRRRLAYDEAHTGNLLDAITEYTRAWKLLLDKKDTSIATTEIAKSIGDLYLRIGDAEHAEEFLAWALHDLKKTDGNKTLQTKITLSLASLYALQRQFELSLPLLTEALKTVPEEEGCLKAIVQNQLSETMYGLGKVEESMGWAQAALTSSAQDLKNQDCLECGGVAANNLGRLLELKGEFDQALEYYKQAVTYSSSVYDSSSHDRYVLNLERLTETLEKNNKN